MKTKEESNAGEERRGREPVARISISLPPEVSRQLDELVESRGFESRSQAVASMIQESVLEHRAESGESIMAGTITLFYQQTGRNLLGDLAALKRKYVDEVIGSLQVQLEDHHLMEVILVQGPVAKLQMISNELVACRGVKVSKLTLTSSLIPPLHPLPGEDK
jgi:CopG family nickel-responsive transcriptional regulator